jgi:hypothetical protein
MDYADCQGEDKFRVTKVRMHAWNWHAYGCVKPLYSWRFVHDFDINDLIMPFIVIDVSDKSFERYFLSVQDVADFESKYGIIPKGSCVMVQTGWSKFWDKPYVKALG